MSKNLIGRACAPGAAVRRRLLIAGAAGSLVASALLPSRSRAATPPATPATGPLQAAFVYVSPIGDAGWTFQHEQGRLAMQQSLGSAVQSRVVANVAEGPDAERVMRQLAADGCGLIVATSFGYLQPALRVAEEFPKTVFVHAGGYRTAPNLGTYNARYYEGRYLTGMAAGAASRSGIAGYVAGFPVPEVIQGINAFTLGMRASNPKAEVRVLWLDTWFDPPKERDAAMALVDQGADVLTHHSGSAAVPRAAEERRVQLVAYPSDMRQHAPKAQLTAVVHRWGAYYTELARQVREGRWQPTPWVGGMADGTVALAPFGAALGAEAAARVRQREAELVAGRFEPFSGRLVDQAGAVRLSQGRLDAAQVATMDWFVEGVSGRLPKA